MESHSSKERELVKESSASGQMKKSTGPKGAENGEWMVRHKGPWGASLG